MINTIKGVEIIQSGMLPLKIRNKETNELETIHMIQRGNAIYVSTKLYSELNNKNKKGE